jgi:hypothetical protein
MVSFVCMINNDKCYGSARSMRPLQSLVPRVYLPNLLGISFIEPDPTIAMVAVAQLFASISTWTMPGLRSLEYSETSAFFDAICVRFKFLQIYGSQLRHLTFKCRTLAGQGTSDIFVLCRGLRSLDVGVIIDPSALSRPPPTLGEYQGYFQSATFQPYH